MAIIQKFCMKKNDIHKIILPHGEIQSIITLHSHKWMVDTGYLSSISWVDFKMFQSEIHNVKLSGSPGTAIKPNLLDYLEIWELCLIWDWVGGTFIELLSMKHVFLECSYIAMR